MRANLGRDLEAQRNPHIFSLSEAVIATELELDYFISKLNYRLFEILKIDYSFLGGMRTFKFGNNIIYIEDQKIIRSLNVVNDCAKKTEDSERRYRSSERQIIRKMLYSSYSTTVNASILRTNVCSFVLFSDENRRIQTASI